MQQVDWATLLIGIALGAIPATIFSLVAAIVFEELKKPHLVIESIEPNPMTYQIVHGVTVTGDPLDLRLAEDEDSSDLVAHSKSLDLRWYNVFIKNTRPNGCIAERLERSMAWAATAGIDIRQFTVGQTTRTNAFHCSFLGRWGSTPEPLPPTDLAIRRGRRINIQPEDAEGLNLILKYDGEDEAWAFSNESYAHVFPKPPGLWRKPDWRIPADSHIRIHLEVSSMGKTFCYDLHGRNSGTAPSSVDLHRWNDCPDCKTTLLAAV